MITKFEKHFYINETCFSQGELYKIVTNKSGCDKKGTLVAIIIERIKSQEVITALMKLLRILRLKVEEITLELSSSMRLIAGKPFLKPLWPLTGFMWKN